MTCSQWRSLYEDDDDDDDNDYEDDDDDGDANDDHNDDGYDNDCEEGNELKNWWWQSLITKMIFESFILAIFGNIQEVQWSSEFYQMWPCVGCSIVVCE